MGYCKTCKYWQHLNKDQYSEINGTSKCKKVVQAWDATQWDEDGQRVVKTEYKNQLFFVQDGSDYYATLLTSPDFGCVQHEEV